MGNSVTGQRIPARAIATTLLIATTLAVVGTVGDDVSGLALRSGQLGSPPAGTPAVGGLPIVPAPTECVAAPVTFADLPLVQPNAPAATPDLTSAATPTGGTAATPEQTATVLATIRLQIACVNAGDIPRALALTGGAYRDRLFATTGTPSETEYATLATPLPRVDQTVIVITAVDGVSAFPDGTLTAQVTTVTTATTVNVVTLTPSASSPTGYVITDQRQVSRIAPTRTPIA